MLFINAKFETVLTSLISAFFFLIFGIFKTLFLKTFVGWVGVSEAHAQILGDNYLS